MLGAIIGGVLALGGSLLSSKAQNKAANKAADTSLAVAQQNNALARDIYGQNKNALSPFMAYGDNGARYLNAFLGLHDDPAAMQVAANRFGEFINNSDYGFQFGEGANKINSGYAGAGMLRSGAAMKDIERFRQDLQSGYRGEWMNALANQQGVGLGAASALAGVGQNYVNTISANNNNAGTAVANAALAKGANNPWNSLAMLGGSILGRSM